MAELPKPDTSALGPLKLTKRQLKYVTNYYDPNSETFGNSYTSALDAGFGKGYASQLASPTRNTEWVLEARKRMSHYTPDHIYQALQEVAQTGASRDKLKALELMGKAKGMFVDRTQSDIHITFKNEVPRPATETIIEGETVDGL